jgi:hypothetical protein
VSRARGLGLVVWAMVTGCAHHSPGPLLRSTLPIPGSEVSIEFHASDGRDRDRVAHAVGQALPVLQRWGGLREPVVIKILPDHEALEDAVLRPGYRWMKAWARYDDVLVQAPQTWGLLGATQREIDQLMLHELTHCVMYQRAANRTHWSRKQIPLWFREGMASVTAEQGYRWPTLEALARYLEQHPERDPVTAPEGLYQGESEIVYGAAHHAFGFLLKRYGESTVLSLLEQMSQGRVFADAFREAVGLTPETFAADFRRYVVWRGFREGRLVPPS